MRVVVDTDNACGSGRGDIDDMFAVASIIGRSEHDITITTTFGNATQQQSTENTKSALRYYGIDDMVVVPGAVGPGDYRNEASTKIASLSEPTTMLCLGPLTNLAGAMELNPHCVDFIKEVVVVGGNSKSVGVFPPLWPHEFNLTKDKRATCAVFNSNKLSKTILPLNIAKTLRLDAEGFNKLSPKFRELVVHEVARWQRRCKRLKWQSSFAVWDLAASMYFLEPSLFELTHHVEATAKPNGLVRFRSGQGQDRVITGFECKLVWEKFGQHLEWALAFPQG